MRKHGWQLPLDTHQVLAIIVCAGVVAGGYAFFLPFVGGQQAQVACTVAYTVAVCVVIVLCITTSWIDPSDRGIYEEVDANYYCVLCQASVQESSKHCRTCERCVEGFDHHCKWLNNCIGSRNYRPFFGLLATMLTMLLLQAAICAAVFVQSFTKPAKMRSLVADKYGASVRFRGFQAALGAYLGVMGAAAFLLGELLLFHVVLVSKGMSTYEYILSRREHEVEQQAAVTAPVPKQKQLACSSCKAARVHDEHLLQSHESPTKKALIKVHINPCAAIATSMPKARRHSYVSRAAAAAAAEATATATATAAAEATAAAAAAAAAAGSSSTPVEPMVSAASATSTAAPLDVAARPLTGADGTSSYVAKDAEKASLPDGRACWG